MDPSLSPALWSADSRSTKTSSTTPDPAHSSEAQGTGKTLVTGAIEATDRREPSPTGSDQRRFGILPTRLRVFEGAYQGSGTDGHLPEYLDDFVFRFNRCSSRRRGMVLLRLLQQTVPAGPVSYRDLVQVPTPQRMSARGVAGPWAQSASLESPTAVQPWRIRDQEVGTSMDTPFGLF